MLRLLLGDKFSDVWKYLGEGFFFVGVYGKRWGILLVILVKLFFLFFNCLGAFYCGSSLGSV